MDLLKNLYDVSKPMQRIVIPSGQVNGHLLSELSSDDEDFVAKNEFENSNTDYALEYQEREEANLFANSVKQGNKTENALSMVDFNDDLVSSTGRLELDSLKEEQSREIYLKYPFNNMRTASLPIDEYRQHIIQLINICDVVIIEGPTGCGKSTQVPQFILDDCKNNNRQCNIAVTQPRRIAAISVSRRVCEERGWPLGSVCGYQVGLDSNVSKDTIISYMTTGLLLRKVIKNKNLHEFTHIIIDEVHERNQDMDFLLIVIRKLINTNSSNTKIILMSATFNTDEFAHYFRVYNDNETVKAPVLTISKESLYNTQIFYSDQLSLIGKIPTTIFEETKIDPATFDLFVSLMSTLDRLDPRDPVTKIHTIGNVLVFLPGIFEIEEALNRLMDFSRKTQQKTHNFTEWHILPLHSSITTEEQKKVFQPPPQGKRKVILSTNIAESSVTVTDIFYVIDFCLTKTMEMDPDTQYQSLKLQWASHVNCAQRAGRVGRVSDGRVYRLVTSNFYENQLPKTVTPEIMRAPLHNVVLASKMLELNEPPKAILALAMNPPNLSNIDSTVLYLKEVGGLSLTCKGQKMVTDGDITFVGQVMSSLPIDVQLSKMIVLGHMFSCLDDCVIMAAGCTLNLFKSPFMERLKAYSNRLQWADSSASDLIAYLNLYKVWQRQKQLSKNSNVEKDWCAKNYVSQRGMKEWNLLVKEIKDRLSQLNIKPSEGSRHLVLSPIEIPLIIKVVICGAFYPNYFKRSADGGEEKEREAVKILGGRDPNNSVYFTGFSNEHPGKLYTKHFKNYLRECSSSMDVSFDGSNKVYVEFQNTNQQNYTVVDGRNFSSGMPGNIKVEVYRAIRMRQLQIPCNFKVLDKKKAWKYLENISSKEKKVAEKSESTCGDGSIESDQSKVHPSVLPSLDIEFIQICISERIDAGHFWVHNADDYTEETIFNIHKTLNEEPLQKITTFNPNEVKYYAALYEDKQFYRCKVLLLEPLGNKRTKMAQVLFIDYGNMSSVDVTDLYELPDKEIMQRPPQSMECYLSEVQPSIVCNPRAMWSDKANALFDEKTQNKTLFAKVYSVVNGIIHLELYKNMRVENSLNVWLIENGYAQHCEESFLSKENHLKRLKYLENPERSSAMLSETDYLVQDKADLNPPNTAVCGETVKLKGPFSPLEMQIYSIVNSGYDKQINIDYSSVNSVVLDNNPQDPHDRLIVAAQINQSANGSTLKLRHTTVMPNINGFPMLMALLFCPIVEIKPTENGTKIGAILCGLGTHVNSQHSLYPNHDISLILDTELTTDDINKLNEIRYWMNKAVESMSCASQGINPASEIEECQKVLKWRLFKFLELNRKSITRQFIPHAKAWGKFLYDADLLKPNISCIDDLWPLHSTMKLASDAKEDFTDHIVELQNVALRMQPVNEIVCMFCNEKLYSAVETRLHMSTEKHKNAVMKAQEV